VHGSSIPLESLLYAIVQSSDDAIISKDLNSIVTSWNLAAERMFGYASEEMVGRSIRTIVPDDRQHEEDHVLAQVRAGQMVDHFETVRRHKCGALVRISLSVSPVRNAEGAVVGASKIARDISERLRAQEAEARARRQGAFFARLGAAFSATVDYRHRVNALAKLSVPDIADWCAIDLVEPDGRIERVAVSHLDPDKITRAERIFSRYDDPDSLRSPARVIRSGQPSIVPAITDEALVALAAGDAERLRVIRDFGLVSYLCLPLTVSGRTLGALTLATAESGRRFDDEDIRFAEDLASRSALAFDNARSYEQLQAANQLKDEFLATLSHELRTPLNAILGYARMLRLGILREERKESALETLERNAISLTQIVEDVLDVSRISAGKIRLNVQTIDVAVVLSDALATVMPAAEAKGVTVDSMIDAQVGPISGDPDRLRQVMWNLLSNAVKFTPRGGHIQLSMRRVDPSVEILVCDTGIGIPEEFLPHLFERFRQADSTTTRAHGGLGLGLAIARQIVELHGGTIHASSDGAGKGSTFRVELPVMVTRSEMPATVRPSHPPTEVRVTGTGYPALSDLRVLAVDDDADALMLIREVLETAGATVFTATSAVLALATLEEQSPDVLISDLGMPGMDGFELIHRVRRLLTPKKDIPAAALTAYARSEDRVRALRAGFEMHLAKPIDPSELIAAIASLARRRSAVQTSNF
jgi:PAS domain S-box-containing protein